MTTQAAWTDQYNVIWNSPSENSGESMPLGGGEIGLNVWVEDGDVLFYVQQSGARDENAAQLKHGRVRLRCDPNPFLSDETFRQELKLRESCIEIEGQLPDGENVLVRLWVAVHRPVVHLAVDAETPIETLVTFESWRHTDTVLEDEGDKHGPRGMAMMDRTGQPGQVRLHRDRFRMEQDHLLWYHRMRNDESVFESSVEQQNLEAVREDLYDPLTDLTWGGLLTGENLVADGRTEGTYATTPFRGWRYRAETPSTDHHIRLFSHISQTDTVDDWEQELREMASAERSTASAWRKNQEWWDRFWSRSYIIVRPDDPDPDDPAWQVGRNYNLFRYQLACNVRGRDPMAFDGGLFTYDPMYVDPKRSGPGYTPDHRQWGPGLTAQNQRLLYWPLLRSGDFDVIRPGLDFYLQTLPSARARVREYWDHEGACYAEQLTVTGLPGQAMWGFPESETRERPPDIPDGVQVNSPTRYLYQAQLEFAYMMLQYSRYSGQSINSYLPMIDAAVRFYDQHYRMRKENRDGDQLDDKGHIVIEPSRTCEAYDGAVNPVDATAGLRAVLTGLLELDESLVGPDERAEYEEMLDRVPPVPTMERGGEQVLAPAESWENSHEKEIPELYPLFPYNLYGIGRDDFDVAKETWERTPGSKDHISWEQGNIFTARLGLTDQAANYAIKKLGDAERRFPTFWGPGHDWVPDHNWGGSGMIGLQEMLVQSHGKRIWLFPAWPRDWDVDFKLHAPDQTTVTGSARGGTVESWEVEPAHRASDVSIAWS